MEFKTIWRSLIFDEYLSVAVFPSIRMSLKWCLRRCLAELYLATIARRLRLVDESRNLTRNISRWFDGCRGSRWSRRGSKSRRNFVAEPKWCSYDSRLFLLWRFRHDNPRRCHITRLRSRQALHVDVLWRIAFGFVDDARCIVASTRTRVGHEDIQLSLNTDICVMSFPVARVQTSIFSRRRRVKCGRRWRCKLSDRRDSCFDWLMLWFAFFMHRVRRVNRVQVVEIMESRGTRGRLEDWRVERADDLRIDLVRRVVLVDLGGSRHGLPPALEVVRLALNYLNAIALLEQRVNRCLDFQFFLLLELTQYRLFEVLIAVNAVFMHQSIRAVRFNRFRSFHFVRCFVLWSWLRVRGLSQKRWIGQVFEEVWGLEKVFEVVRIERTFSPAFANCTLDVVGARVKSLRQVFDLFLDVDVQQRQKLSAEGRHVEWWHEVRCQRDEVWIPDRKQPRLSHLQAGIHSEIASVEQFWTVFMVVRQDCRGCSVFRRWMNNGLISIKKNSKRSMNQNGLMRQFSRTHKLLVRELLNKIETTVKIFICKREQESKS